MQPPLASLPSQERAPCLKKTWLCSAHTPLCSRIPSSTPPTQGLGLGLGWEQARHCHSPAEKELPRAPTFGGTLTPPPGADAADPECLGVGWDLSCPCVVSPTSGVTQSALTDHLPVPWHRSGIFQGFFPVPLHPPAPAGSQGYGISLAAALGHVASFWELLQEHFSHQPCSSHTPCPAPHRLLKRWKKLSKPREGWDFGAGNIFKSCSESRQ